MTLWALVSDVHGQWPRLRWAHEYCCAAGVERFVSLGDMLGRGAPSACVAWVRDHATLAIQGNRDRDYLDLVAPDLQAVVSAWTHEEVASNFVLSHGDPKLHRVLNSAAERDGFRRVSEFMALQERGLWFFGHTHRARIWRLRGAAVDLLEPHTGSMVLEDDARYVVNVGTCGLPLPGRGGPSFVLYDDVRSTVEVVGVPVGPGAPKRVL